MQSFLRGWLCRRKWKTIIQDYIRSPHADSMRKRNQVVFSMLEAEAEYVQQLHILVNNFLRPLRMAASSKKPPITHDDVSSIFLNRRVPSRAPRALRAPAEPAASVSAAPCPPPGMGVGVLGGGGLPGSLRPGPPSPGWKGCIPMGPAGRLAATRGGAVGAAAPGLRQRVGAAGGRLREALALAAGRTVSFGIGSSPQGTRASEAGRVQLSREVLRGAGVAAGSQPLRSVPRAAVPGRWRGWGVALTDPIPGPR